MGSCPALESLAGCSTAAAWTPRRAPERAPGLFASRAESWWRPQRRRCATGLVVLLGWCDHPAILVGQLRFGLLWHVVILTTCHFCVLIAPITTHALLL